MSLVDPADSNDDGVIHGLSFDWTAFDIADTRPRWLLDARTVDEFREQTVAL